MKRNKPAKHIKPLIANPVKGVDVELAKVIDHTILKPKTKAEDIRRICQEALDHGFASVCMPSVWVLFAVGLLKGRLPVGTVIGFPDGTAPTTTKQGLAFAAVITGAVELDMVINVAALKAGRLDAIADDIRAVVQVGGDEAITKVILETTLLTDEEIVTACHLAKAAGAVFVKTSTGLKSGATVDHVKLMRATVGADMGVKASGGIRTREDARKMIAAGATRIGTSSGVAIVTDQIKLFEGTTV